MEVPQVFDRLRAALPDLARDVVTEVWGHLPGYETTWMRRDDLERAVLPNLASVLDALEQGRGPTEADLSRAAQLGQGRALQGVPVEGVLQSWRTAERLLLDSILREAQDLGVGPLRELTRALGSAFDQLTDASVAAYRRVQDEVVVHYERLTHDLVARLVVAEQADPEEIDSRARLIDVDPDLPYQAVALAGAAPADADAVVRAHRAVLSDLAARIPGRILSGRHAGQTLLLAAGEHEGLAGILARSLGRPGVGPDVVCGLGQPQPRLAAVGGSVAQAVAAVEVGLRRGLRCQVVTFTEVIPDVLLSHHREAAEQLVASRLGPLLTRKDLIETLEAYLAEGQSVTRAAARLGVHQNTIANRLRRIALLLGRDLDDLLAATDLLLALHARELLSHEDGRSQA